MEYNNTYKNLFSKEAPYVCEEFCSRIDEYYQSNARQTRAGCETCVHWNGTQCYVHDEIKGRII